MDSFNILAMCVNLLLLGYLFGAVAFFIGAASGRVGIAVGVSAGTAVVLQVVNAMAAINGGWWGKLTPFYWYSGTDPLNNGLTIEGIVILALAALPIFAANYPAFNRRDLIKG